jgi:predicted alpha-1,2-mannosidase
VERKYSFVIEFNSAFHKIDQLPQGEKERAPRYLIQFKNLDNSELKLKVALSTTDILGAQKNLEAEINDWNFDRVKNNAKNKWRIYLERIKIEATEKEKRIFYTALYHLFIQPNNIADVDGRYRGADDQIRVAPGAEYYSTFSLWDTYRAAHPLYTLLVGYLPIWTAWGQENHCMIGNHSVPVIVDACLKGFDAFDQDLAMDLIAKSLTENHPNSDWSLYEKHSYYPFDELDNESVSRTLEHAVDDYAAMRMAETWGDQELTERFRLRRDYYQNLWDEQNAMFRGRDSEGSFRAPFDPLTPTSPMNNPGDYTEANAWQYLWTTAQFDIPAMIELFGAETEMEAKLDSFFSIKSSDNAHLGQEGMIGQYAHGNEPSHHVAYLYHYLNAAEKSRQLIRTIRTRFYTDLKNGITGNEDCGQMSAWYIFSSFGFYPVNPIDGNFVLSEPQYNSMEIALGEVELNIKKAKSPKGTWYLNGSRLEGLEISYASLKLRTQEGQLNGILIDQSILLEPRRPHLSGSFTLGYDFRAWNDLFLTASAALARSEIITFSTYAPNAVYLQESVLDFDAIQIGLGLRWEL